VEIMDNNNQDFVGKNQEFEEPISIAKIEDMNLDETQFAERLYYSAGLDPIIEAGMKDYEKRIQTENKLINKVFGIRESDIRGYSESVAKRVALAVYGLLNEQYGGKVGNLRSYVLSLEDERNRANTRYDELMGRVIGILGDEYKELRTDSKEFIEKLTKTLGDDLKDTKIDQKALAERLADIDGLRSQISNLNKENEQLQDKYEAEITGLRNDHKEEVNSLNSKIDTLVKEKEQLKEKHESQVAELKSDHKEEVRKLNAKIDEISKDIKQLNEKYTLQTAELNSKIAGLHTDKTALASELENWKKDYQELKTAISTLAEVAPNERTGEKHRDELYEFLIKDSKVPAAVMSGVGHFIDFKKYLGLAVERGANVVSKRIEEIAKKARNE
jgi:outer membrane murein-binding lipoprotein Lpp